MKPKSGSKRLLAVTNSAAKMVEFNVPPDDRINIPQDPALLFPLSIGLLSDYATQLNSQDFGKVEPYVDMTSQTLEADLKESLLFASDFFDAYMQSELNQSLSTYLLLVGAIAYYLADFAGSAVVLASRLHLDNLNLQANEIDKFLLWLLQGNFSKNPSSLNLNPSDYSQELLQLHQAITSFYVNGTNLEDINAGKRELLHKALRRGNSEEILFANLAGAIITKRINNSVWLSIPRYSNLPVETWQPTFQKATFIEELWPAQHLIGEKGILQGKSGVIQMPTSAGKTKAIELIIRSAFLANRTNLAIVVAPFRALSHEIKSTLSRSFQNESVTIDEISDVLQMDLNIQEYHDQKTVLVLTPEKLLFILRHNPELNDLIGLLIYDEGHQFDNGSRGITYELLLTALKNLIPENTQSVLISAVISNAEPVNNWLHANHEEKEVVSGSNILPTKRSIAFASWKRGNGSLEFVDPEDPNQNEYYVPGLVKRQKLKLPGKAESENFPSQKSEGRDFGIYLALKAAATGAVAVFCGTKIIANSALTRIVDLYQSGFDIPAPLEFSDKQEITKLENLYAQNLGDNDPTKAAGLGVFSHHADTPTGIRQAVEYAIQIGKVRYVVCTSTLAQGVNLPLRYLFINNLYQGGEKIKNRDFHNLAGRTGRVGMHTEGIVAFSDPEIYDERRSNPHRWNDFINLLDPQNSEPSVSTIFELFNDPIRINNFDRKGIPLNIIPFAKQFCEDAGIIDKLVERIAQDNSNNKPSISQITSQIIKKVAVFEAVESFLMAHMEQHESESIENNAINLARETLAYFLANKELQIAIEDLFSLLAKNIENKVTIPEKRKVFGRTLYGIKKNLFLEEWTINNLGELLTANSLESLLITLWPLFNDHIKNSYLNQKREDLTLEVCLAWLKGQPYHQIHENLLSVGVKIPQGKRNLNVKIEHIVSSCDHDFGYNGSLLIAAVIEFVDLHKPEGFEDLLIQLSTLQKCLKYGLPDMLPVTLFEMGFADRVISQQMATQFASIFTEQDKASLRRSLRRNAKEVVLLLDNFPSYFKVVLEELVT